MRTITYNAGAYLVEELLRAGIVAHFLHDGGDILLFQTHTGERVSIHLIESSIELYEVKSILAGNEAQGIHTLFILWCDRLLPGEGWQINAPDWMEALFTLYGGLIYAYDVYGNEIFIFPVYFERIESGQRIRYGTTVHVGHLRCTITGTIFGWGWRVADFASHRAAVRHNPLRRYYELLGLEDDDDAAAVKKAYRLLARRYHPDLNRSPDATAKMQQINDAYERIMAQFTD
jgi:hypothetical protein